MGGRGASSGYSVDKHGKRKHKYGTEYTTVYQSGNIKFIKKNEGSANAPMETMTNGRVYVTLNSDNKPAYISYYDKNNKRSKQIDLNHFHPIDGAPTKPHTHKGYEHSEHGDYNLSPKEKKMVDRVIKTWYNRP